MTGAAKGAQNPGLFPPSVAAGLLPPWLKKELASVLHCHAITKNLKSRNSSFET